MNYTPEELKQIGFGAVGKNVSIHRTVQIISPHRIFIGDRVRVDCFSLLSAGKDGIHIGNNVHIAAGVMIFGGGGRVDVEDFVGLSSRVAVYTASDDYSGTYLTNPTVPDKYKNVICGPVAFRRHSLIGAGCIVMPGIEVGMGASVGALSFIRKDVESLAMMAGNPMRMLRKRDDRILELEKLYLQELEQEGN